MIRGKQKTKNHRKTRLHFVTRSGDRSRNLLITHIVQTNWPKSNFNRQRKFLYQSTYNNRIKVHCYKITYITKEVHNGDPISSSLYKFLYKKILTISLNSQFARIATVLQRFHLLQISIKLFSLTNLILIMADFRYWLCQFYVIIKQNITFQIEILYIPHLFSARLI